jgi:hypothetical protein
LVLHRSTLMQDTMDVSHRFLTHFLKLVTERSMAHHRIL